MLVTKKPRIILFTIVVFFLMFAQAWSATYYVDYLGGNDANNGTSLSTAFKHCPGDSAGTSNADITLSAGDTVIFKGGVTYTGTGSGTLITVNASGSSGNYITYRGNTEAGDWGDGEAIIDGNGTYYKLFSASGKDYIKLINLDISNSENALGVSVVNQGMIHIASGCDYWLIQDSIIHSPENYAWRCMVGADGTPYDQRGIFFYGSDRAQNSNIEIDNLHTYALAYPIRIFKSNNIDIYNSEFSGAATERGTCQGAAEDECGYMSMPLLISNNNSNINIYDNVFRDGWYYQGDDNATKRCHSGDWIHIYGNSNDIIIERNKFYNDRQFVYSHGTAISFIEDTNGLCQRITFRNNLFLNPFAGNGVVKVAQGDYIHFLNNTFVIYNHTSSTTQGLRLNTDSGDNCTIKNNIFIHEEDGSSGGCVYFNSSSWAGEIDGNLYYRAPGSGVKPIYYDGLRYTAAELHAAYPQFEANGSDGNPNVKDYGSPATCGYADLHLTSSSSLAAIDLGLNLTGFSDDKDGIFRPQASAWDIGAYEYDGGSNQPPSASFNADPTSGEAPLTVQFTDTSTDPDGTIEEWSWVFGDSGTSTAQNPTHTYNSAGTSTVTLTVTDDDDATDSASTTISVSSGGTVSSYVDTDGDGIPDDDETDIYGTDPNNADTDGDGINDGDELAYWGDDWDADYDGDGLINLSDPDADGDSVSDGEEINQGFDPADPDSKPQLPSPVKIWLEAEEGYLSAPMETALDDAASSDSYIWVPNGLDSVENGGFAEYTFEVPEAGNYVVWGRVISNSGRDDSFFVSMDGGDYALWDTKQGGTETWVWDQVSNRDTADPVLFYLEAGEHTLIIKQREDGTKIDKILITNENEYVPEGLGEENSITIYEDAEDGTVNGWSIYDNTPAGATITNVYDEELQSGVIQFTGSSKSNGYRLRNDDGSKWCNSSQFVIEWSMKYSELFIVYIDVETTAGQRYIQYTPVDDYLGKHDVRHGLGSDVIDGQWHTFVRDLQADLEEAQPGVTILEVNGFFIRGSGRVDDIKLYGDLPIN